MKIVLFSDPHFGNPSALEGDESFEDGAQPCDLEEHEAFAKRMHDEKPDVLICAGDCAETCLWSSFLRDFFRVYKNPHGVSLCIPGNHDLWLGNPIRKTWRQAYDDFYSLAAAEGWTGLRHEPWSKDGVHIVGHCGWYDFSTIDPAFTYDDGKVLTPEDYDRIGRWSDYGMMRMRSALKVNDILMAEFRNQLEKVPKPEDRKALLVFTHMVGFSFLLAGDFPSPNYGRGFMANLNIGKDVAQAEANYYYCGHSHRYAEKWLGNTRCINNGSGYGRGSKRYDVVEF